MLIKHETKLSAVLCKETHTLSTMFFFIFYICTDSWWCNNNLFKMHSAFSHEDHVDIPLTYAMPYNSSYTYYEHAVVSYILTIKGGVKYANLN